MVELEFEKKYVHEFYSSKAKTFSDSRVKAWPYTLKFNKEYVKETHLVLDAGCGNGRQFMHSNTIGVDFSENLLIDAKEKQHLMLIKADVHTLPFRDEIFDVVLSIAVIHHLSTHERRLHSLMELNRVLKQKCKCLLYVWHKDASSKAKFSPINGSEYFVSWRGETDLLRYYCLFDESMLKQLCEEAGFLIIEMGREQESLYAVLEKK